MEADPGKQRSRQKRRERALQLQQEKQTREEEEASGQDDQDGSPPRSSKDKPPRSKPKKVKSALFEEDIIDGFAIMSFKTLEELESVSKKNGCLKNKCVKNTADNTDTLSQEKEDNKIKKKKVKKSPSINSCSENRTNNGDVSDGNTSNIAASNPTNSPLLVGGPHAPSIGGHLNDQSSLNHHHHHNHQHNGPLEPPRSISRDRLSDASTHSGSGQGYVCDVESGDDKASESGSDLFSGIPTSGLVNHLPSNGLANPCVALTAPTPPPSTSSTPTSLCNGIGGVPNHSPSPVHQILASTAAPTASAAAATATTTTTSTSSTSRPGLSVDALSTTSVTASTLSSSVIQHPAPYVSPYSPPSSSSSSLPPKNKRTLSPPSSQQLAIDTSTSSSCARSLQYSKSLKANHHAQGGSHIGNKGGVAAAPPHPAGHLAGGSQLHHIQPHQQHQQQQQLQQQQQQQPLQQQTVDNVALNHFQNGPGNLSQPRLSPQSHLSGGHYPYHSPVPNLSGYPSSLGRPDPLLNPLVLGSSPRVDTGCATVSQASALNNAPTSSPASAPSHIISPSLHHHHHHHQHGGKPSVVGVGHPQQHFYSNSAPRNSSPTYQHKPRVVSRTPPLSSAAPSSATSSAPWTPAASVLEPSAKFSQPLPPKVLVENFSAGSVVAKDVSEKDKVRFKDVSSHASQIYQAKDQRDREKERDSQRTPITATSSLSSPSFPAPKPVWSSSPLYNQLLHHHPHTPTLHPLGPQTPSGPPQTSPIFPLPLAPPPPLLAAGTPSLPTAMFAPPIPPAPPSLAPAPLTTHPTASSQFSAESLIRSQDYLHQDLNNRLLAHRDSSSVALPSSQFVRNETHQHQHQHQHLHNHMHQHTYSGLSAVPPAPPLFDKMPKVFESGVFRPSLVPSYSAAFSSLLPPGPSGASLASSLQGAFQPKKQGKWCAVHVRVAWEIYHRQQKQPSEPLSGSSSKLSKDSKPLEPTHLLPSSRPPELGPTTPSSLLASVARSVSDGIVHPTSSFLSSANLVSSIPSFPRPSPYAPPSLLNPLGFSGLGSSMFAPVRDIVPTSQTDWRLHRAPSSFPSWPKSDLEREKEREREIRKEEEKDRERRSSTSHRLSDESRHKDLDRPKSRSRSRSPLRNGHGRIDHHIKTETGHYDRRPLSASSSSLLSSAAMKLKEERREDDLLPHHLAEREKMERERLERERMERERMERERLERERLERDRIERERLERERIEKEKLLQSEREKMLQAAEQRDKYLQSAGYIGLSPFAPGLHAHPGLLDRRLLAPPGVGYPFLDRAPVPTTMWNPFDNPHRVELDRERERLALMSRLGGNIPSIPSHLAALEQERLKEQILLRDQQERDYEIRRQYLDRLPAFNADRLRAADPLALSGYFPRTISPMFGPGALSGLKSNSPHIPGVPPALIPSSSSTAANLLSSRSHDNSPSSSSKSKGCSPADSTSDLKDKREGSSTDPDGHSR